VAWKCKHTCLSNVHICEINKYFNILTNWERFFSALLHTIMIKTRTWIGQNVSIKSLTQIVYAQKMALEGKSGYDYNVVCKRVCC